MTDDVRPAPAALSFAPILFTGAVFVSAALVFLVEPMVAQLLLPRLGGSAAVWNTSLAFFQGALLLGYAYAHLLQRLGSVRRQMVVHLAVLAAAALVLPLHITSAAGLSAASQPILWLLSALALSIGGPFAALSATAPLLQAWFGRVAVGTRAGANPYVLYAASNLGSLLALLAYPFIVQPLLGLTHQALSWSLGYGAFGVLLIALIALLWTASARVADPVSIAPAEEAPTQTGFGLWRERITWVLLAAAPSSLLLGVTAHITTDVASAPFLWVLPLALYLLTFVAAFQARPLLSPFIVLMLQGAAAPACLLLLPLKTEFWLPLFGVHLLTFFLTALVCHQALASRRPSVARLTEFYLLMSLGGVLGGAFNAFVAPVIFNAVWEYPMVLVVAGLARPWGRVGLSWQLSLLFLGGLACGLVVAFSHTALPRPVQMGLVAVTMLAAFLLRDRAWRHVLLLAVIAWAAAVADARYQVSQSQRSFFGVIQIAPFRVAGLGPVRLMVHGSTLHGAEMLDPAKRCIPMVYYAPADPIGQVFRAVQAERPAVSIGAIGLGSGAVASYVRAADTMRFFEIDPLVVKIASDPAQFRYLHDCAKGPVSITLGDARLSLASVPDAAFDILLVDAFSSDSVPVHLMTVQAMRTYLRVVKPGGVIVMHLSNRNLDLAGPAAAMAAAAGAPALLQTYVPAPGTPLFKESGSIVLIAARTPQALHAFRRDPRWRPADPAGTRVWTDDYSNVLGALIARLKHPE